MDGDLILGAPCVCLPQFLGERFALALRYVTIILDIFGLILLICSCLLNC